MRPLPHQSLRQTGQDGPMILNANRVISILTTLAVVGSSLAYASEPELPSAGKTQATAHDQAVPDADQQKLSQVIERVTQRTESAPARDRAPSTMSAGGGLPSTDVSPNESRPLGSVPSISGNTTGANKAQAPSISSWFVNTLLALLVVVAAVFLLRAILSKLTGRAPLSANQHVVDVLARVGVSPKSHVMLVKLGRRILVVGDSPSGLSTLADIDDADEVASLLQAINARKPGSASGGFDQMLGRLGNDYDDVDRRAEEGSDLQEHRVDRARDNVSALVSRLRHLGSGGRAS